MDLSDVLRSVGRPVVPSAECLDRAAAKLEGLPLSLTSSMVLETPLDDPDAPSDVSFAVLTRAGRDTLAEAPGRPPISEPWRSGLAGARALAQAWRDPQHPLRDRLGSLWIELDAQGPRGSVDLLFARGAPLLSPADAGWLVDEVAPRLGRALPGGPEALDAQLAALPPSSALSYVGFAGGLRPPGWKICVEGLTAASAADHARRLGWTGAKSAMSRAVTFLEDHVPHTVLQLGLDPELSSRVGLEGYRPDGAWQNCLQALVEHGLASPLRVEQVRAWTLDVPRADLSPALLLAERATSRRVSFLRAVSHVKLSVDASGELRAKAYLWAGLRWIGRGAA